MNRANHIMQRMRASRSVQSQFGRRRRLARTADGDRWAQLLWRENRSANVRLGKFGDF
jgi:hypothetical protein